MKIKRVFLIILDSVGAGEASDAASFGDAGSHTLRSIWNTGKARIDTLRTLGIGNIDGLSFLGNAEKPLACVARMREASLGKDTTIGHWEIAGHISTKPLPTFPDGFGEDILEKIRSISGREILCNSTYSGTEVIRDFGKEAFEKKALIVYTSADSVLQIAAHTDVVPLEELYRICSVLREELVGEDDGVGRIIARPFKDDANGGFVRTADRRDYSLKPPCKLLPEAVKGSGLSSIAVGKISDIFADVGFTESERTHSNKEGMEVTQRYIEKDFRGLCFVNLVDFDMLFGHRRDTLGYAAALSEFDAWLSCAIASLNEDDVMIISADHGCDPDFTQSTDHTREDAPLIIYGKSICPENFGVRLSFADIGATVARMLGIEFDCNGKALELNFKDGEIL